MALSSLESFKANFKFESLCFVPAVCADIAATIAQGLRGALQRRSAIDRSARSLTDRLSSLCTSFAVHLFRAPIQTMRKVTAAVGIALFEYCDPRIHPLACFVYPLTCLVYASSYSAEFSRSESTSYSAVFVCCLHDDQSLLSTTVRSQRFQI